MANPLLTEHSLPPFGTLKVEHIEAAIDTLIASNFASIEELVQHATPPTWESLVAPIEALEDKLHQAWSPVSHLNSVANNKELREAYNRCLPKLTDYATKIGQNHELYSAYVVLQKSAEFSKLSIAQQRVITNAIRDFKLSGVALNESDRAKFAALSQTLAKLQSQFQDNVMDATDHWHWDIQDASLLNGIPTESQALAKQLAEKNGVKGWRLTLDFPCYYAVVTYADNPHVRQTLHEAYSTRASAKGPHDKKWDNTQIMEQILATRHELAQLLGFANYAEDSLAKKMAKHPQEVMDFLHKLAAQAKPYAQKEMTELQSFVKQTFDISELAPWDIAYYSEKLRVQKYDVSQEALRPYFPANVALQGMFEVVKKLYGLTIKLKDGVPAWHNDVQFFEIYDSHQELRGMFYLDLFARNQKRGGAWMDEARVRRRLSNEKLQLPIAYLTCNFRPPLNNAPSLLTHDEVVTLFHEFGHGLHHMLTEIDYSGVSGINGVAWDAVELPSQFMENWCWQKEALAFISSHHENKRPLPDELLAKMLQAKNFQSGMKLVRQLEFSLFDFRIHLEFDPAKGGRIQEILDEVRAEVSVVPIAPYNSFQHGFSHIFGGGYAAGYYSYLWAEVLSCDAFSKFEEEGIFNRATGQAFLEKILEKGGSEDAEILFKDFRGRAPSIEPLLRQHGLSASV